LSANCRAKNARPPALPRRRRPCAGGVMVDHYPPSVAARYVGCSPSTITRTMLREPEFADSAATAAQNAQVEALRLLRNAARKDPYWRAAAWLLESKNPCDFAARLHTALSNEQIAQMLVKAASPVPDGMSDEEFDKVLERFDDLFDQLGENRENANKVLAPPPTKCVTDFDYESLPLGNCATDTSEDLDDLGDGESSQDDIVQAVQTVSTDATDSPP
jgi:hypothetical protein